MELLKKEHAAASVTHGTLLNRPFTSAETQHGSLTSTEGASVTAPARQASNGGNRLS